MEVWPVRLGAVSSSIRCGKCYKDKREELLSMGFSYDQQRRRDDGGNKWRNKMEGEEYVENTVEVMEEGMVMEEVEEEEELGDDKKWRRGREPKLALSLGLRETRALLRRTATEKIETEMYTYTLTS